MVVTHELGIVVLSVLVATQGVYVGIVTTQQDVTTQQELSCSAASLSVA